MPSLGIRQSVLVYEGRVAEVEDANVAIPVEGKLRYACQKVGCTEIADFSLTPLTLGAPSWEAEAQKWFEDQLVRIGLSTFRILFVDMRSKRFYCYVLDPGNHGLFLIDHGELQEGELQKQDEGKEACILPLNTLMLHFSQSQKRERESEVLKFHLQAVHVVTAHSVAAPEIMTIESARRFARDVVFQCQKRCRDSCSMVLRDVSGTVSVVWPFRTPVVQKQVGVVDCED